MTPGTAVWFARHESRLAWRDWLSMITAGRRERLRRVVIAKDLGTSVDISSGLVAGDKIINNPPDSLQPGDQVKVAAAPPPAGSAAHAKS